MPSKASPPSTSPSWSRCRPSSSPLLAAARLYGASSCSNWAKTGKIWSRTIAVSAVWSLSWIRLSSSGTTRRLTKRLLESSLWTYRTSLNQRRMKSMILTQRWTVKGNSTRYQNWNIRLIVPNRPIRENLRRVTKQQTLGSWEKSVW